MKFIDEATIRVRAGNGGNGVAAFRREKYIPKGGPSGGDGGEGGSVYAAVDKRLNTLHSYRFAKVYQADAGGHGSGKDQYGKNGSHLVLLFPQGTLIFDRKSDDLIADLKDESDKILLASGGKGGLGNLRFKSSVNRTPRQFTLGEEGQVIDLRLELKLLADVGLIGFPNAGKSTYISKVTAAKPRIADYPFTTLVPNLGVMSLEDVHNTIVVADIPGLVKNASVGAGMGIQFLRHIQRTKLLLHFVDISTDIQTGKIDFETYTQEGVDKLMTYIEILEKELYSFNKKLMDKPRWIVFNKIDFLSPSAKKNINKIVRTKTNLPFFFISCYTGEGLDLLKAELGKLFYKEGKKLDDPRIEPNEV